MMQDNNKYEKEFDRVYWIYIIILTLTVIIGILFDTHYG